MVFKQVKIQKFKNLNDITLDLDKINIIVGSNNSGKSSILQAIQFAVSIAQTTTLVNTVDWNPNDGRLPTSIAPTQLIYSPLKDVYALAPYGDLKSNRSQGIIIAFVEAETEHKTTITVSKGRNKNIAVELKGQSLGQKLQSIETPYCVYVPGLAGIQNIEDYKPPAYVRKAAARGDANNVFRNILWLLKTNPVDWDQFNSDLSSIFPNISIEVDYDPITQESINASIKMGDNTLPIDAAGTGVLQAIQILSYVNVYKPHVLLLDEPDSHLHPNNQRLLARTLIHLAEVRNIQIIMCSHSRHILDELSGHAKIHWVRDGELVQEDNPDVVNVLMELGALDIGDRLRQGSTKCIILTEDENIRYINKLLESSGFHIDEIEIWSYKGCSKKDIALTLAAFIRKHAPLSKIIIHQDRDYLTDEEISQYKRELEGHNVSCFITSGTDVESHFISAEHINQLYPSISSKM